MRDVLLFFFFFNDTATTEIYTLSLHDALPISLHDVGQHAALDGMEDARHACGVLGQGLVLLVPLHLGALDAAALPRSEEHTSELQSRLHLVCRLLLEKKKKTKNTRVRQDRNAA